MSQTSMTDRTREAELDGWYVDHLTIMLTVPGVDSAQRFKTSSPDHPSSLAMYTVAGLDVFHDPYYLSVRGMGEWNSLMDMKHYRRNLFDGLDRAPQVAESERLLVADRMKPEPALLGLPWAWLECVGIDRSTPFRAIAVVPQDVARRAQAERDVVVYAPVTPYRTKK